MPTRSAGCIRTRRRAPRGINYIRNSVKITIDAYDGTMRFHLIDTKDPVAATLARVFPGLFEPLAAMPEDLRTRLRYPQGIFSLQAAMFATFHMTNPSTFYNREDQWDVPSLEQGRGEARPMVPYYTIMKLPGETDAEYIQMLPYTPRQKDNLAAWMVARSDGEHYGQLDGVPVPETDRDLRSAPGGGPHQPGSGDRSADHAVESAGLGSDPGNLLVIPIEESLLYIRPLYLRAAGGRIPELKRVIVAYQNHIVMEATLERSARAAVPRARGGSTRNSRFGENATARRRQPEPGPPLLLTPRSDGASEAQQHYQRALEAQRAGDWARYGEEIRLLGETLKRLNAPAGPPPPAAAPAGCATTAHRQATAGAMPGVAAAAQGPHGRRCRWGRLELGWRRRAWPRTRDRRRCEPPVAPGDARHC